MSRSNSNRAIAVSTADVTYIKRALVPFNPERKRQRKGIAVIEKNSGLVFESTRAAGDYFNISHFDIRQYCQWVASGYAIIINKMANSRIKDRELHFEFMDSNN
jgi:hypothetical protein